MSESAFDRYLHDGTEAAPAFRIAGNTYYVGTRQVSAHLVTGSAGHVLVDTCWPKDGLKVLASMQDLDLDPTDVEIIMITHAHVDHMGSADWLAAQTGASVMIHADDLEEAGVFVPHAGISECLEEGRDVRLGDIRIAVYHTPGHTRGCCSFAWETGEGRAALFGGPGLNVFRQKPDDPPLHCGTVDQYIRSVQRLQSIEPPEFFLGPHPHLNRLWSKYDEFNLREDVGVFGDTDGWYSHLHSMAEQAESLRKENDLHE